MQKERGERSGSVMADTQQAKKVAKRREHGRQQAMGVSVTHGGVGAAAPRPPQELGT